jgi:hypothetical protein
MLLIKQGAKVKKNLLSQHILLFLYNKIIAICEKYDIFPCSCPSHKKQDTKIY